VYRRQLSDHAQLPLLTDGAALDIDADEPHHHGFNRFRFQRLRFGLIEQRTTAGQLLVPTAIAQQTVMANPHESSRERV
jgi:hypothetical protein